MLRVSGIVGRIVYLVKAMLFKEKLANKPFGERGGDIHISLSLNTKESANPTYKVIRGQSYGIVG